MRGGRRKGTRREDTGRRRVGGDVIVISGTARLAGTAQVKGNVYVLGGAIEAAPGASIGGDPGTNCHWRM